MRRASLTKEELAERSKHSTPHVLALFEDPDPNPSLELFLDLMQEAGARFHGVAINQPIEVIKRLKEIMARESVKSLSALAKIADVNRSQLSTMWNQTDPNPMLATFDRLVVALGAEQDFVVVNIYDAAVAEAIVAGGAEVQAKREAKIRHLHSVPPTSSREPMAEPDTRAVVEAVDAAAREKLAEVTAKVNELYKRNVELEKQRDDQAAELVRQRGTNAKLERLRAADAAEIARLTKQNQEYEGRHATEAAGTARAQRRSRELEQQRAHAVAEAARMHARNSELERRHLRNVAELERLKSEGGGWSWMKTAMLGVAGVATGIAGTIIYYEKRKKP